MYKVIKILRFGKWKKEGKIGPPPTTLLEEGMHFEN
jgi:hypothetical protein